MLHARLRYRSLCLSSLSVSSPFGDSERARDHRCNLRLQQRDRLRVFEFDSSIKEDRPYCYVAWRLGDQDDDIISITIQLLCTDLSHHNALIRFDYSKILWEVQYHDLRLSLLQDTKGQETTIESVTQRQTGIREDVNTTSWNEYGKNHVLARISSDHLLVFTTTREQVRCPLCLYACLFLYFVTVISTTLTVSVIASMITESEFFNEITTYDDHDVRQSANNEETHQICPLCFQEIFSWSWTIISPRHVLTNQKFWILFFNFSRQRVPTVWFDYDSKMNFTSTLSDEYTSVHDESRVLEADPIHQSQMQIIILALDLFYQCILRAQYWRNVTSEIFNVPTRLKTRQLSWYHQCKSTIWIEMSSFSLFLNDTFKDISWYWR